MKSLSSMAIGVLIASATSAAVISAPASASTGVDLTQKNGCMACHGVDKKILGPAFKDVAKKYKGNADAGALLAKKVKDGGSGVWGPVPMPANGGKINDADIKTMVDYVLSLN